MPRRYELGGRGPLLPLKLGAALLFMKRMADVSETRLVDQHPIASEGVPRDVLIYEIAGPLFFGAAQKAMSALHRAVTGVKVVVLDLSSVPAMDATGLVSLEADLDRLHALGVFVVLGGVQGQPLRVLARAGLREKKDRVAVTRSMERALEIARERSPSGRTGATGRLKKSDLDATTTSRE